MKYLSVMPSHTNDLSLSSATWYVAFQLYSTSFFSNPLSIAMWEDSCGMNGVRYVTIPRKLWSSPLVWGAGIFWSHWPLMDLGGLCACHKHSQGTWQSPSWLHTLICWVPVLVTWLLAKTCVVSCHVSHHPSHAFWCHLQFQCLLCIDQGSGPSFSGRYPVDMQVWMEGIQSKISLCVCWR